MTEDNKPPRKIKPCPFCGANRLHLIHSSVDEESETWAVWCSFCRCSGPLAKINTLDCDDDMDIDNAGSDASFAAWNKRVPPQGKS